MPFKIMTSLGTVFIWKIKAGKPKFPDVSVDRKIIELFQADGPELEEILKHFHNLPHTKYSCTWRGDMAQFIYDNL